jgi:peptidoglycan hydrolase-like protein with peptidoglycan-binding domain
MTRAKITVVSGGTTAGSQTTSYVPTQVAPSSPVNVGSVGGGTISRNLSYGSQGADVTALQNFLISKGYLAPGNAIGFFGRLTEAAVKKFQSEQGIVSSGDAQTTGYGNVGPGTRKKIQELSN